MLHINDLTLRVQGDPLLEGAAMAVHKGERVGLVGRNGAGKTTLLRLVAGAVQPDEGSVSLARNIRVGWLPQEAPGGEESLLETVLAADQERASLLTELDETSNPERIAYIHERLVDIEADSAPARAARILAGLGFDETAQGRACAVFSGGWRMRIALAALLFSKPDLMLLDEPTNHLDLEATLWFEGYLRAYPGAFLLVSHERSLLNRVVNRIVHLSNCKLRSYTGNYEQFERARREQQRLQSALHAKQQAERRHMQAFIDRFRYKASKARQAQSRLKALERMEPIAPLATERGVTFAFPSPRPLAPPILTLEKAAVGYADGNPILRDLDIRIDMDDRIALLGANGNGKSTLARLLAAKLKPMAGSMTSSPKLAVGYFSQDQAESLDFDASPLSHLEKLMPNEPETRLRAQLGRFGFGADRADVAAGKLSGGEKARLLFALVSRAAPQLLILDEPTNHLDIDSRQALIQALGAFEGAVVLVSHDPHLVQLIADRLWLVADGTVRPFDGDMEDYRRHVTEQRRMERERAGQDREAPPKESGNRKRKRQEAARQREANSALRRTIQTTEKKVDQLTTELKSLEAALADPTLYDGEAAAMTELQTRHAELRAALATAEEQWLNAQAAYEAALAPKP